MEISRLASVRAGLHFPLLAYRSIIFGDGTNATLPDWAKDMRDYYEHTPAEVKAVFCNPQYGLDKVLEEYRKFPSGNQLELLHLNEVLHSAFYRMDDFVYRWFRLGQSAMGFLLQSLGANEENLQRGLVALKGVAVAAGLNEKEFAHLIELYSSLRYALQSRQLDSPLRVTSVVFDALSQIAISHDRRHQPHSQGGMMYKTLSLLLLMLAGFSGFFFLGTLCFIRF